LKKNKEKYDLILFDLPGAKSEKMLPLYSLEMFSFIHSALDNGGIFVK
jgi:predicted membrane-bound spermidine synthase